MESQKARHPQLLYESKLYKILQGGVGIPHIRYAPILYNWLFLIAIVIGARRQTVKSVCKLVGSRPLDLVQPSDLLPLFLKQCVLRP